ncbi:hypothetical protein ABL78_2737 [Leptomonas seymouri]|uniref:DUF1935 domain-containing protein n=1 Tax=Leptomonas seymouri TaxID=5684 RepID=A0A0N1I766_LEPSE|nr:hypothetical protein ABL78_2737 [Leptomonas seymouri]|eukprot:KPI88160.1 hypothetical protein ABL78_2737 [Leptomonas seymouri]
MGCKNSTTKSADDKKSRSQYKAQAPAEKPKNSLPSADVTQITMSPTVAAPLKPESVKESEKKEATEERAVARAGEGVAAGDRPNSLAGGPAVLSAAAKERKPEEESAPAAALGLYAVATPAPILASAVPVPQVATAPEEEDILSCERGRRASVPLIYQRSQSLRVKDPNSPYVGPGPTATFPIENIYRCFEKDNGLLFRLVNKKRHIWAFYNDTTEYMMRVRVTFGPESSITPLSDTQVPTRNIETGECTLVLAVPPGETKMFMRGEYNGFITCYDAVPLDSVDEMVGVPMGRLHGTKDAGSGAPLRNLSGDSTRIHFLESDPSVEEPQNDLKKRREEV